METSVLEEISIIIKGLGSEVEHGILPNMAIVKKYNENRPEAEKLGPARIAKKVRRLPGMESTTTGNGALGFFWRPSKWTF